MLLPQAEHVNTTVAICATVSVLSINHDDDYIGFKLRARYTLPRLGGYKKMCHQRGGLRPHQQEKHQLLLQFNYIILWISNSIELHRLRVCAHTNIFYVFPDGGAANGRTVFSVRGAAHGRTVSVFSKHRAVRLFA